MKYKLFPIFIIGIILMESCMSVTSRKEVEKMSYSTVMEVYDWGPSISKLIIYMGDNISKNSINKNTFSVYVERKEKRENTPLLGEKDGELRIKNVYVSDKDGNPSEENKYIVIEFDVGPNITLLSPINYSTKTNFNAWIDISFKVVQKETFLGEKGVISGLIIQEKDREIKKIVDKFIIRDGMYDNIPMVYSFYKPEKRSMNEKKPLIIWLHGMGEGGYDGILPIAGNKAVNFSTEMIQSFFGGAYVLVPQAPTYWMEGPQGEFGGKISKYTKALMELIQDFVINDKEIDRNRIYIGGASNGGYMTMIMIINYPDFFAAAFPVCEAFKDSLITDEDLERIKNIPIWFTASKDDPIVPVKDYTLATYNRLIKMGAKNVYLSLYDGVIDKTGLYKDIDGNPYKYNGHWSWIYVYNNDPTIIINNKEMSIMEWLSSQYK